MTEFHALLAQVQPVMLCPPGLPRPGPEGRFASLSLAPAFAHLEARGSLFQQTSRELALALPARPPLAVCLREHETLVQRQLAEALSDIVPCARLWSEPPSRGSALAAAALALQARDQGQDPVMLFVPADLHIGETAGFLRSVAAGAARALAGRLVAFGVPLQGSGAGPWASELAGHRGVLRRGSGHLRQPEALEYFSPTLGREGGWQAGWQTLAQQGEWLAWTGVWMARASRIAWWLGCSQPALMLAAERALASVTLEDEGCVQLLRPGTLPGEPGEPIEWALLDGHAEAEVLPAEFPARQWSQWRSVWRARTRDAQGNVSVGPVVLRDCEGCLVLSENQSLEVSDMKDVAVVGAGGRVLVMPLTEVPSIEPDSRDPRSTGIPVTPRHDPFVETQPPGLDVDHPWPGG